MGEFWGFCFDTYSRRSCGVMMFLQLGGGGERELETSSVVDAARDLTSFRPPSWQHPVEKRIMAHAPRCQNSTLKQERTS